LIAGIGTDIVSVQRIQAALDKHGARFAERILRDDELAEFATAVSPAKFLSKRFASKEAFSKALGTGIGSMVSWQDLSVTHDAAGKPSFSASLALLSKLDSLGISATHLSISDETTHAIAFVVLEKEST